MSEFEPQDGVYYQDNLNVYSLKFDEKIYEDLEAMESEQSKKKATTILWNDYGVSSPTLDAFYSSSTTIFKANYGYVYRKTPDQQYFDYICALSDSTQFKDYGINNHEHYEYMAALPVKDSEGKYKFRVFEKKDESGNIQYIYTNWGNWSICNIEETTENNVYKETGDVWILGLNLEGEALTQNLNITTWDTLGRYPKLSMGEKNYISGSVTTLLGRMREVSEDDTTHYRYTEQVNRNTTYTENSDETYSRSFENSQYSRELEKYIKWKSFCNDGSLKLLKDVKGNAWVVQITASPEANINTIGSYMPTTITFAWAEVLDIDEISIIGEGE